MKLVKRIIIFLFVLVIGGTYCFVSVRRQNGKAGNNSKTTSSISVVEATPSASAVKMLDLNGNSSIIITIYPSVMEEKSYLMELFDNGIIETSAGLVTRKAYIEEFTGTKEDIFEEVIDRKQRVLTDNEIEEINKMISRLDWESNYERYKEKEVGDDADQKMIWIGNKAYYFWGILPSKNEFTMLIEEIAKCSPIKVEVR